MTDAPKDNVAATGSPFVASLSPDQLLIHEALCDSQFIAGAKAGWNAGCIADPDAATAAFGALMKSRDGHLEGFADAKAALAAQPAPKDNVQGLPQDVVDLVIAAREFWDANNDYSPESYALDKALEPFAERVPYENEPDAAATEGSDRG